jgi:hypothetical protein
VVFDANPCIELRSCQAAARLHSSLVINNYYEADGAIVFREACRLGCEGIVSKRLGSSYPVAPRIGPRSKTPKAPAVKREAEPPEHHCRLVSALPARRYYGRGGNLGFWAKAKRSDC